MSGREAAIAVAGLSVLLVLAAAHVAAGVYVWRLRRSRREVSEDAGGALAQALAVTWDPDGGICRPFATQVCAIWLIPVLLRHPKRRATLYVRAEEPAELTFAEADTGKGVVTLLALAFGELGFLRDVGEGDSDAQGRCVAAIANLAAIALAARAALPEQGDSARDRELLRILADQARTAMRRLDANTSPELPEEGQELHSADPAVAPLQVANDEGYELPRHLARVVAPLGIGYRPSGDPNGWVPALVSIAPRAAASPRGPLLRLATAVAPVSVSDASSDRSVIWRMALLPGLCALLYGAAVLAVCLVW